jgi:glutamate-1-semialdehyde 2,1-aminomutase
MEKAENAKNKYATASEAVQAAKQRFTERNSKSMQLHKESVKSLPGGNKRSLLHTAPFPIFLKSAKGYEVTSEDGHTYTDLVGELTAGLYGHSHPLIQDALIDTIHNVGLNLGGTTTLETRHAALVFFAVQARPRSLHELGHGGESARFPGREAFYGEEENCGLQWWLSWRLLHFR